MKTERSPIFRNEPRQKVQARRLLDLIDVLTLYIDGEKITNYTIRHRIRKTDSEEAAELVIRDVVKAATSLGFDAYRTSLAREGVEPAASPRGRGSIAMSGRRALKGYTPREMKPGVAGGWALMFRHGGWALMFRHPRELLAAAQAELSAIEDQGEKRRPKPKLDSSEKAQLGRLIDLEEIAKRTVGGDRVNIDFIADRLLATEAVQPRDRRRVADRRARALFDEARFLKHVVSFQPDPEAEEHAQWVVTFDDLEGFLRAVSKKIESLIGRSDNAATLRYERLKLAGLCVFCGKAQPRTGMVSCRDCANDFRERRERRIEAGLCPDCRGPIGDASFSSCASCRAEQRRLESQRRKQGLCPQCGDPALEGRVMCATHAMADTEYHAERYRGLKDRGLCRCKKPLEPGLSTCRECRERTEAAELARVTARRSRGVCIKCGAPAVDGLTVCEKHREAYVASSHSKRVKLKAAGLCRSCRDPWTGETLDCDECRKKFADAKAARLASGICQNCGVNQVIPGLKRCQKCADEAKARYESLKAQGICVTCKKRHVDVPGQDTICAECRRKARDRYLAKRGERP